MQSSNALYLNDDGQLRLNLLAVRQVGTTDCGVACLSGVLNYWGFSVSQDKIKSDLGHPPKGGYTLANLRDYALRHDFSAFVLQGSYDTLQQQCALGRPCIIVIKKGRKTNHSLVVVDLSLAGDDRRLLAMDPANGKLKSFPASEINARWAAKGYPLLLIGRKGETNDQM